MLIFFWFGWYFLGGGEGFGRGGCLCDVIDWDFGFFFQRDERCVCRWAGWLCL